jgi:hypothetical protein
VAASAVKPVRQDCGGTGLLHGLRHSSAPRSKRRRRSGAVRRGKSGLSATAGRTWPDPGIWPWLNQSGSGQ